jgi:hypothetical protein
MNNHKFSKEYDKFMNHFNGLPVDFSNPKVEISELDDSSEYIEDRVQFINVTYGDASQCELVVHYISYINHESLKRDFIDKNKRLELLKEEFKNEGLSEEEIDYWTEEEVQFAENTKEYALEFDKKSAPCDFEGYVITPDLSISYSDNLLKAMIGPGDSEKLIILYGDLNSNDQLPQLTMCSYNLFDFIEDYSFYEERDANTHQWFYPSNIKELKEANPSFPIEDEHSINCNYLLERIEFLKSIGINPEMQLNIDFQQFLTENGLENMYDRPAAAIFLAKKTLMDKAIKMEEEQKSNSRNK